MRLSSLLNSPRKIEVLKILKQKATKRDIESELNLTPSRSSQILGDLERLGLVERNGSVIEILPKGRLALEIYGVLSKFNRFFEKCGDHINELELSDIPNWLIARLYELDTIKAVHNSGDVIEPHEDFLSIISHSDAIKGYTPVFFSEYFDFLLEKAERGVDVSIVLSKDVLRRMISDFPEELERILSFDNFNLYVSRSKYRFAFAVTETHFLISFYLKNGVFDYMRYFVCEGDAVRWGNDLFEFVKASSELVDKIKLSELLRS